MIDALPQPRLSHRQILLLLVALTLVRGLIYASLTPPWWQGHDEEFHFAQVRLLTDQLFNAPPPPTGNWPQEMVATMAAFPNGRWSPWPETQVDLVSLPTRFTTPGRSSLSYYTYAWLNRWLIWQDILFQLFVLRLVSVLTTCGTIVFAFLSARQLFDNSPLSQILVPWLVIFNPAFMVTGSTVSDANLAILLTTIVFYLLLLEITQKHQGWRLFLAVGLTIVAFITKATTYFLLPVWSLLLVGYAWKLGRKGWVWFSLLGGGLLAALLFVPTRFQEWLGTLQSTLAQSGGITTDGIAYAFSTTFFWDNFTFFWIILGWSVYRLAQIWYLILFTFLLLCLLGLLRYTWRHLKDKGFFGESEQKSLLLALLFIGVSMAVLVAIGIIRYEERDGRSARYIFPVIVPLAILMVTGWRELLPPSWRNIGLVALAVAFFLFDTLVWVDFALPWYYPLWPY
jgi:hypothetical protein